MRGNSDRNCLDCTHLKLRDNKLRCSKGNLLNYEGKLPRTYRYNSFEYAQNIKVFADAVNCTDFDGERFVDGEWKEYGNIPSISL